MKIREQHYALTRVSETITLRNNLVFPFIICDPRRGINPYSEIGLSKTRIYPKIASRIKGRGRFNGF